MHNTQLSQQITHTVQSNLVSLQLTMGTTGIGEVAWRKEYDDPFLERQMVVCKMMR